MSGINEDQHARIFFQNFIQSNRAERLTSWVLSYRWLTEVPQLF